MKKVFYTFFLGTLFLLSAIFPEVIHADCSEFSFSPNPVVAGNSFSLIKSQGLIENEFVRLTFSDTGQEYVLNCIDNPSLCSSNPTSLFNISADVSAPAVRNASLTYIDALGASFSCPLSITITSSESQYCEPITLESVAPSEILMNESVEFVGCIGPGNNPSNNCNGASRVVITKDGDPSYNREIPIGVGGTCTEAGEFTRIVGGFDIGVYRAQLYIGNTARGAVQTFNVGSGQNQFPGEGDPCTVVESGMVCNGTFQLNENNVLRCTYTGNQCITCEQCATDPSCTNSQRIQCENSTVTTAGMVSVGCTGGVGQVSTAIGCIPFTVIDAMAKFFLAWGIGIGGGMALLLVGYSGIMLASSGGNPEKVNAAKSLFFGAISGLIFLVLAIFLLRFIGVDVLGLFA